MTRPNISTFTSVELADLQAGARTVLYEEIAEYFYLFARKNALSNSSVQKEVDYHIGNLVLISLYFDVVLIQTASIFNSVDPFVRKVADGVLSHHTFREMIDNNAIKIVGWGGNSPKEMFEAAQSFSIEANPMTNDADYCSIVASVFNSQSTVSRSATKPDDEIEQLFRSRLEQTTIIRREEELESVNAALAKSMGKTGQLVAVSFNPELSKLQLSAESLTAVGTSFIKSWHDHLESEIPGVITYAPLTSPVYINQKLIIDENAVRTFLYSPQIFASFLSGYLRTKDFNKILKRPYGDLLKVKNGDWARFCDAYHKAINTVSQNIGHLGHSHISDNDFSDQGRWSKGLVDAINREDTQVDVNTFIESLAMLSGIVLSIPFLGPLFKTAGLVLGETVNDTFHSLRGNAQAEVSPFITKLLRHYELEGARA